MCWLVFNHNIKKITNYPFIHLFGLGLELDIKNLIWLPRPTIIAIYLWIQFQYPPHHQYHHHPHRLKIYILWKFLEWKLG